MSIATPYTCLLSLSFWICSPWVSPCCVMGWAFWFFTKCLLRNTLVYSDGESVLGIFRPRQNVCSFKFLRLNFYPGCHLITAIYAQQNSWAQFLATDGACFVLHMRVRRSLMRKCEGCRCTYKCTHTSTLLRLFVLPPACQESAENSTNEASEETRALETWSKEASCRNEWKYKYVDSPHCSGWPQKNIFYSSQNLSSIKRGKVGE